MREGVGGACNLGHKPCSPSEGIVPSHKGRATFERAPKPTTSPEELRLRQVPLGAAGVNGYRMMEGHYLI